MINYPIGDFLIRLKNGYSTGKTEIEMPYSKIIEETAKKLVARGFLLSYKIISQNGRVKKIVLVKMKYGQREKPAIRGIELFSKPGRRYYASYNDIPYPKKGGVIIISTSSGLMDAKEARTKKIGGEIIAEIS